MSGARGEATITQNELSDLAVTNRQGAMSEKPETMRYVCGAPPGGCGFRGRDWRKGQEVAGFTLDGKPYCKCGSEMRAIGARPDR